MVFKKLDQMSYMIHTTASSPQLGEMASQGSETFCMQSPRRGNEAVPPHGAAHNHKAEPQPTGTTTPCHDTTCRNAALSPTSLEQSSKRTWYPTTLPSEQPISSATRCATEMVATRRGWVTPMAPCLARPTGETGRTGTLSCAAQSQWTHRYLRDIHMGTVF